MSPLIESLLHAAEDVRQALPGGSWPLWLALLAPMTSAVALAAGSRARGGVGRRAALATALTGSLLCLLGLAVAALGGRVISAPWAPTLGVRLHLAVDHLSAAPAVVAALAALAGSLLLGSDDADDRNGNEAARHALGQTLLTAAVIAFLSRDAILLVLAVSAVLVPAWALAYGSGRGTRETRRTVASRVSGSLGTGIALLLAGTLLLTSAAGTSDLGLLRQGLTGVSRSELLAAAVLICLGGVLVVPLLPGHTWWTALAGQAEPASAVVLAGTALPLGAYTLIRLLPAVLPGELPRVGPWLGVLAVLTVLWCGLVALTGQDLARVAALLVLAPLAGAVLALSTGTAAGLQAAAFALPAAGLTGIALFGTVAAVHRAWGGTRTDRVREPLRTAQPRLGGMLVGAVIVALGLPGTMAAWPSLWTAQALLTPRPGLAAWAGWVLAVAYLLALLVLVAAGLRQLGLLWASGWTQDEDLMRTVELPRPMPDSRGLPRAVVLVAVALSIILGLMPVPLARTAARAAMTLVGAP